MNIKQSTFYVLMLAVTACTTSEENKKQEGIPVLPVVQLQAEDTSLQNGYVADIQAVQNVEIRSKVQGYGY